MIKIGIIGAGYWGPNVVRNFDAISGCEITRLADVNPTRLEYIHSNYPYIHLTTDYRDILTDTEIDAVYIATPVSTHYRLAMESLKADKHVLVEKPMCQTMSEAEQLVDVASAKHLVLSVGHIFQYTPAVAAIRSALADDVVGRLLYFESSRINMGPPATEVDVMWDLAPHDLSILFHLVDERPESVRAVGYSYTWPDKNINDMTFLHVYFQSGICACIHLSWLSAKKTRLTRIFAERGSIIYDETAPHKVTIYGEGVDNRKDPSRNQGGKLAYGVGDVVVPELDDYEPLRKECEDFLHAIVTSKPTVSHGEIGLRVVQVLEAATRSVEFHGREVKL